MQKFAILFFLLAHTFTGGFLPAQTTYAGSTPSGVKILKVNAQGTEQTFTIIDAVKIVRFFMSQEGVYKCESDLTQNTLKIITLRGYDPVKILLSPALHNQISDLGYKIVFGGALKTHSTDPQISAPPPSPTTAPTQSLPPVTADKAQPANPDIPKDCTDCGDQNVSKDLIEKIVTPDAYDGTQILIDFDGENADEQEFDTPPSPASDAKLDSLRQIYLKPDKPK